MADRLDTPVSAVMTDPVRTVAPDLPAREAARVIDEEGIGSVVVADPPGVVTKTDLVSGLREGIDFDATPVSELLSRPVVTVAPDDDVQTAVDRMEEHGLKRLLVESGSEFVGIVTTTDLAAELAADSETVVGIFAETSSPDPPYTYECVECGRRTSEQHRPGECPGCGSRMRNISVPRE